MQNLLYASLFVYSQLRDELCRVLDATKAVDARYANFAGSQLHYYSDRCQSLNILLQNWRLWDCDIVLRSALECSTRFLFVAIAGSKEERDLRIDEYAIHLNEIEDLQRSEKAKTAVDNAIDNGTLALLGGVILTPAQEAELRARWTKAKRNTIRQKWSFSEIARNLANFQDAGLDLRKYKSFLHGYGISSHLIHADQTAIDVVWDRMNRIPSERKLMERAHFARLAVEPTSLLFLCWRAMSYSTGVDSRNEDIERGLIDLTTAADRHHEEFAQSQAHRYKHEGDEGSM